MSGQQEVRKIPKLEKWASGAGQDIHVPAEIARLREFSELYTFATPEQTTFADNVSNIIGPGPDEVDTLESIKSSISTLKPYVQSILQENRQLVQVLEVYPTGETGYKTAMSLNRLLLFVRELIEKNGDKSPGRRKSDVGNEGLHSPCSEGDSKKTVSEIQFHDLRYLESQFHTLEEPTVLVRKHSVLLSLNPLRAIVTADRMILIVPDGADSLLYMLHDYMHGIVEDRTTTLSPDLRAYNALFSTMIAIHQQEYISVCAKVEMILSKFQSSKTITVDLQETIRVLKNRVSSEGIKVAAYQRLLRNLLSNGDDLAMMNLAILWNNEDLYKKPLLPEFLRRKEDVSDLIESYLMDYNTLGTKLEFLRARMQNTDELISFRLDSFRNELLIADTTLSIVMMALSVGTYFTNIFGMNITSGLNKDNSLLFWLGNLMILIGMTLICFFLLNRYNLTLTGTVPVINSRISRVKTLW